MTCKRLQMSRRQAADFDALGSVERDSALEHFSLCSACRSAALEVDTSLLFSMGLPRAAAGEDPEREVERMRTSVAGLRRAERLRSILPGAAARFRGAAAAAAAVLVTATLLVSGGSGRSASRLETESAPVETAVGSPFTAAIPETQEFELSAIEELDRPLARVYQLTEEDLSLVMIVDETLDI